MATPVGMKHALVQIQKKNKTKQNENLKLN